MTLFGVSHYSFAEIAILKTMRESKHAIVAWTVIILARLRRRNRIELRWTPQSAQMQPGGVAEGGPPSIFTALREQLGLKLESAKGSVTLFVIDHIEKPSEN